MKTKNTYKAETVIIGENVSISTDCEKTGVNNNILVCGGTGCGKTLSISEPRLLATKESSLILTLTKRRLVSQYRPLFIKRGYSVMDLNFADPANSEVGFDPMDYVKTDRDVLALAEAIVYCDEKSGHSNFKDPYWDRTATSLLAAEISLIHDDPFRHPGAGRFTEVLKLHDKLSFQEKNIDGFSTSLDSFFALLEAQRPKSLGVSCWKTFREAPVKTAQCIYSSLNTLLDTMFPEEMRKLMENPNRVRFEDLAREKTILFVTTSPVNASAGSVSTIFYEHAFRSLFEFAESLPEGRLPVPVHVLCDDFATGGRIAHFEDYISIFREKGISVSLLLQSESQLETMYGAGQATTIINNCDTYVYMGGMDLQTCRSVSLRMDLPLNEVLCMPVGRELIFRRGQKPVVTERYNIRADKTYREITGLSKAGEVRGEETPAL